MTDPCPYCRRVLDHAPDCVTTLPPLLVCTEGRPITHRPNPAEMMWPCGAPYNDRRHYACR